MKLRGIILFLTSLFLAVFCAFTLSAAEFQAAAAAVDITPDLSVMKVPSSGYGARGARPMEGVHDPVKCKALVVSDGREKAGIVACDLIGISPQLRHKVLAQVGDVGFHDQNLMITASHTHSGPGAMQKNFIAGLIFGRYNEKLTQETADRIARALHEAHDHMAPASVRAAVSSLPDLNRNRRDPGGSYNYDSRRFSPAYDPGHPKNIVDPDLTSLWFESASGEIIAVLFNFAAHPTVLGADNMLISADWPGAAQARIEAALPGAVALFMNGAIGDQAPTMLQNDGIDDLQYVELIGTRVAEAVLRDQERAETVEAVPVAAVLERRRVPPGNTVMGFRVPRALIHYYFPEMPLQVIRLGEVAFLGAPLEMVAEIGLAMKAATRGHGIKYPVVAGLANDIFLYCATPEDFEQGGYEVFNTIFGEIEAGLVIGEEMLLLRQLLRQSP